MAKIFSLQKIANGDIDEQAGVLYAIAPRKFSAFARKQGEVIESQDDLTDLLYRFKNGDTRFSFLTLFKYLPITASELKKSGREGVKVI